jgi:hypothetical protein
MTATLKTAFDRLSRLSERDQEFYARQLLHELDADARWDELFDHTSADQWAGVVAGARQDATRNGTLSLEELKASL